MVESRISLREYDIAWQNVVGRAINGFVDAHPLLGAIRRGATQHTGPIRNVRTPQPLDMPRQATVASAYIKKADVRACDIDAHTVFVVELAEAHVSATCRTFYQNVDTVTTAAGMTHDARGQPPSWDVFLDALEKMDLGFDRDGRAELPVFVAHPDTLEKFPPPTPEQQERLEHIISRKEAEHAATKRTRRLPR